MNKQKDTEVSMEKIVSLCKRRGFIFQGSEIYGGLAGTFDYGPLGVTLKKNIENIWWKMFVEDREDMYGIDAAILMSPKAWVASGHVGGFSDPLIECAKCKKRHRADNVAIEFNNKNKEILGNLQYPESTFSDTDKLNEFFSINSIPCPDCGNSLRGQKIRQFNMMFSTNVGPIKDDESTTYLRPETAGGMFVNFKNVVDTMHPKLPFGMGQIGKAFRNEIAPRDFIFRVRELEQMEIEYFVHPSTWEANFEDWRKDMHRFIQTIGLEESKVHELEVTGDDLAHYSKRTIDFEFDYPFGRKELYGLAYRGDFDLSAHQDGSGQKLEYFDEEKKEKLLPHVIEPSFGVGRTILAVLCSAYKEDSTNPEDIRPYLALAPRVAPIKVSVFPLLKNKEVLTSRAKEIYSILKKEFGAVVYDEAGSIGKRYRKQDEIGTPYCVTVDFDTVEGDDTVTLRDRDTGAQERISMEGLQEKIRKSLA